MGDVSPLAPVPPAQQPAPPNYETALNPQEQQQYEAWAKAGQRDPEQEKYDYDLPGYFKSGGQLMQGGADLPTRAHLPDTFKKPNHPTFSDESMYHGVGGAQGGHWDKSSDGTYTFTAGGSNIEHWGPQGLQKYFQKYEPKNRLIIPDQM